MSVPKGYPSKERDLRLADQEVHVTAEPIRQKQLGMSVLAHMYVYSVGTDAVEANSTTKTINATSHVAKVGDVIRFTSGALSGQEVKVQVVSTNIITLAEVLASAPATAVTFEILRHKYPVVNSSGELTVSSATAPVEFVHNGVNTQVEEDTGTPSNSRPLPVKLMGLSGDVNITAGDLNVDIDHTLSSVKIGDGTDIALVTAAGELNVIATPQPGVDIGDVTINNASIAVTGALTDAELRATAVPVSGTFYQATQPVSAASLPLPTGAATEVTLAALDAKVTAVNTGAVVVSSSALPTGAATEATLSTLNGKVTAVDTGAVVVASSALPTGASTEATLSTLNGKVTAVDTGAVVVASSALPSGASTEATLSTLNGKVPSNLTVTSTRLLVDGSGVTQPVSGAVTATVDRLNATTFVRNDYSSTSVTTAAYVELVASTAATYKRISIFDSSGQTLKIAIGAAASEVDKLLVFPGGNGDVEITVASGSRISIRAVSATASVGEICINFFV